MIYISELAEEYFRKLLLKEEKGTQIRVFVEHVGTNYAEGKVTYCLKDEIQSSDNVFHYCGFSIYIDKKYLPYLKNAEIDLIIDNLEERLTLKAPYAKNIIIPGNLLQNRIEEFLEYRINPQLLSHGGKVTLIKVNTKGYVILQFSGGCNGCSMVKLTLKEGIEKTLLLEFPELKGVQDVTEHQHGIHSFY
ncbi:Fe/S biogenesis protein NfuA [Buchnera aphidicola (Eriosoma lanigerum)]|uniref:NfuA family Fe-S biogenesis protein n=1 Tax=Buchnera aphidicola TaxID=9 RepID=UPI003463CD62